MRRLLSILTFLLLLPFPSMAQWSFDVPSIEAYIADHKDQRSLLLARSALEQGNVLLHQYSSDANAEYKAINVELDKYTRASRRLRWSLWSAMYASMDGTSKLHCAIEGKGSSRRKVSMESSRLISTVRRSFRHHRHGAGLS